MRKHRLDVLCSLILGVALTPARAAFQQPVQSPRAQALGGAVLADQGSAAFFTNPAATLSPNADLYFMYHQLLVGVPGVANVGEGMLTGATPSPFGMISAGISNMTATGLTREQIGGVALAHSLTERVAVGAAAKFLWHGFSVSGDPLAAQDPTFAQRTSRGAFAADLGMTARLSPALSFGFAAQNVNAPDVGLAVVDRVPRTLRGGLAYAWENAGVRAFGDLAYSDADPGTGVRRLTPSVGLEKALEKGKFHFRVGASRIALTAGFGVRFDKFGLDYAFTFERGLPEGSGAHSVGLSVLW